MKHLLKLTTILLCVILCLSFAACGSEEEEQGDTNNQTQEDSGLGLEYVLNDSGDSYTVKSFGSCTETKLTIPNVYKEKPVTAIGESAFEENTKLTSVTIPDSVVSIGNTAFKNCKSLGVVKLSKNLNSLGAGAFLGCTRLVSIEIPSSLSLIEYNTFNGCIDLVSVVIGSGVTEIQENAFSECHKLVEVKNNSSAITVTNDEANGCVGLNALSIFNSGDTYESKLVYQEDGIILHESEAGVFLVGYTGDSLSVDIPSNVDRIWKYAFYGDSDIYAVSTKNVSVIEEYAFYGCYNLLRVELDGNLSQIEDKAFWDCVKLVEIVNRSTLKISHDGDNGRIGNASVYNHIFDGSKYTGSTITKNSDGYIYFKYGTQYWLLGYIGDKTDISIPAEIDEVYRYAFYKNEKITSVFISKNVTEIGSSAFEDCINLKKIEFEKCDEDRLGKPTNGIDELGTACFKGCENLEFVIIPKTVDTIYKEAFVDCKNAQIYLMTPYDDFDGCYPHEWHSNSKNLYWYTETDPVNLSTYVEGKNYWRYVDGKITLW